MSTRGVVNSAAKPPAMLQRLRPLLGSHARLSNVWRLGSRCLLPRAVPESTSAAGLAWRTHRTPHTPCIAGRRGHACRTAATAAPASPPAQAAQQQPAASGGDAARSTAYPFPDIEAKWQRCVGVGLPLAPPLQQNCDQLIADAMSIELPCVWSAVV